MSFLISDLNYGTRLLWKNKGFAATAVTTLAVCIGVNAAIFSVVHSVVYGRDLAGQLVNIEWGSCLHQRPNGKFLLRCLRLNHHPRDLQRHARTDNPDSFAASTLCPVQ